MSSRRTTIMILVPGRNAISFDAPRIPPSAVVAALLLPLCSGLAAERCFRSLRSAGGSAAIASLSRVQLPRAPLDAARVPAPRQPIQAPADPAPAIAEPEPTRELIAASVIGPIGLGPSGTFAATREVADKAVISAQQVLRALTSGRRSGLSDVELEQVPISGNLRLQALHLDEEIDVRPFDPQGQPDAQAMSSINHLLRCRVTGDEVEIDSRLVAVLVQLHALFGKPIQLVSGHRVPRTLSTKPTSQHAIGRAADIRIPGVSISDLKRVAIKFGARGVGMYPEKGFVHVDVRDKNRYYWRYTAADGEQPDMGMTRPVHAKPAAPSGAAPDSEEETEPGEAHGEAAAHGDNHAEAAPAPAPAEPRSTRDPQAAEQRRKDEPAALGGEVAQQ
jgi:uncharacterized protein YcbK (DUF882 family)